MKNLSRSGFEQVTSGKNCGRDHSGTEFVSTTSCEIRSEVVLTRMKVVMNAMSVMSIYPNSKLVIK